MHWALLAFRGLRLGCHGVHLVRRSAAAFPALRHWCPEGVDHRNTHKLGDLIANLAAESLNTDILETMAENAQPGSKSRNRLSKLHSLAATWRTHRRRLILATIVGPEGLPCVSTEGAVALLAGHWGPIFQERKIQAEAALEIMPFTPHVPENIVWKLDKYAFGELVAKPRDGAPGPDGIPYGAWRLAGQGIFDVLFRAYEAFLEGTPLPEGFNHSLMVFIPKGEEESDRGTVARTPGSTRPISLSNTVSKFFALAVNRPLAQVAALTVHPRQRGFVAGRSLLDNVIEVEGYAQAYTISDAADPAILLFDIAAAFPSLAHQWLFVVLRRMKVPRFMIMCIQELYRDCFAEMVLLGQRWGRLPIRSGIRQGCPASGSLFVLAMDPCIRYLVSKMSPRRGILTAFADDLAAAVPELFPALVILEKAFQVVARCSSLELHPGKVVVIPLWKYVESEVRASIADVAPSLATALIQNFGKLLGFFVGPGAPDRQWSSIRLELRMRSRFLASLGLAWSGVLPLFRSHVLPVASHRAQLCPIPASMFRTEESCMAIVTKTPFRAVPAKLFFQGKAYGLGMDVPDLKTLGKAATFRAAESSMVLMQVVREHARARASSDLNISPFLREWSRAGAVGHLYSTSTALKSSFCVPPPSGRGLQAWVVKELRQEIGLDESDLALGRRVAGLMKAPVSHASIVQLRSRMSSLRKSMPPVVLCSVIKSSCNAWTTSGRFSGLNLPCPFGCRTERGDKWAHFATCTAIRGMWREACPSANLIFEHLSLETVLLISPELSEEVVPQVALWVDVVGHLSNDMRAQGTSPTRALIDGAEMIKARLRQLAVQSNEASAVISAIRVP
jgi:hypothetical protein